MKSNTAYITFWVLLHFQVRSVPVRKDDEVSVVRGTYKVSCYHRLVVILHVILHPAGFYAAYSAPPGLDISPGKLDVTLAVTVMYHKEFWGLRSYGPNKQANKGCSAEGQQIIVPSWLQNSVLWHFRLLYRSCTACSVFVGP